MALPATDNFNRSNETPLASPWQSVTGLNGVRLVSNQIEGAGSRSGSIWTSDLPDADQYVQVVIRGAPQTNNAGTGVAWRFSSSAASGYYCYSFADHINIYRISSGSFILIRNPRLTLTSGDTLRVEMSGTTITIYVNGEAQDSFTDSTHSGGYCGVWGYNAGSTYAADDFECGNLVSATGNPWYCYAQQMRQKLEEKLKRRILIPGFADCMRYGYQR